MKINLTNQSLINQVEILTNKIETLQANTEHLTASSEEILHLMRKQEYRAGRVSNQSNLLSFSKKPSSIPVQSSGINQSAPSKVVDPRVGNILIESDFIPNLSNL